MRSISLFLFLAACISLTGCPATSTPSLILYQSVSTDEVTVRTATALLQAGTISDVDATVVYRGALATESALQAWQAALNANSTTASTTAALVAQDISTLLAQLQAAQSHLPVSIKMKLAKKRYTAAAPVKAAVGTVGSASDIIALIEEAITLAPSIEQWANSIFGVQTVTADQVTAAFTSLDASLAALKTVLASSPPATAP
jgi:hypothetical protein